MFKINDVVALLCSCLQCQSRYIRADQTYTDCNSGEFAADLYILKVAVCTRV